jgi:GGDEF domain-containing protein
VPDDLRSHPLPRARPVADLPIEAVLAGAGELARRWAIALILDRPLESIGDVPLEQLAREAPGLCSQALRALQSDVELDRLTGGGAPDAREDLAPVRRLPAICGAGDAAAVAQAAESLRGVLWEALLDQLELPSAHQIADASDRLAYVCAAALAAALSVGPERPPQGARDTSTRASDDAGGLRGTSGHQPALPQAPAGQTFIVDEGSGTVSAEGGVGGRAHAAPLAGERAAENPASWDPPLPAPPAAHPAPIAIRDERGEQGPAAWIGSIGAQLERFAADGLPFAVLLVEILEIERLRREESADEVSRLAGHVEQAIVAELRGRSSALTRERPGRCWLLVPRTDGDGAAALAERLLRGVTYAVRHRGQPLAVAIGTAVCPDNGREAAALAAHADVGLYAARRAVRASASSARELG